MKWPESNDVLESRMTKRSFMDCHERWYRCEKYIVGRSSVSHQSIWKAWKRARPICGGMDKISEMGICRVLRNDALRTKRQGNENGNYLRTLVRSDKNF